MTVGGANVVRRRVLGRTWFPVAKFKDAELPVAAGVWLLAVLLVVGVCPCVTPPATVGDWWTVGSGFGAAPAAVFTGVWWTMVFVVPVDAGAPDGEGGPCVVTTTVGFRAADSAAATGDEVLMPPIPVGVVAKSGPGWIVCAVWVVIPNP